MNTIIENKIESLLEILSKLEKIIEEMRNNKKLEEFLFYAAEKKAEEAVELAISINQELLKTKKKVSLSYYESFTDLSIFKEFSSVQLKELASTAGFRNRLAHEYLTIDPVVAKKSMEKIMKIYPPYLKIVKKVI